MAGILGRIKALHGRFCVRDTAVGLANPRLQQAKRADQMAALQKAIEKKEAVWQRLHGGHGRITEIKARFDEELALLKSQRDELQAERSQLIRVRRLFS